MPPALSAIHPRLHPTSLRDLPIYAIKAAIEQLTVTAEKADRGVVMGNEPSGLMLVGISESPRRRVDWLLEAAFRWQEHFSAGGCTPSQLTRCDGRQLAKELRLCREDGSLDPIRKLFLNHSDQKPDAKPVALLINQIDQAARRDDIQLLLCQFIDAILRAPTLLLLTLPRHPAVLQLHPLLESRLTGGLLLPLSDSEPPPRKKILGRPPTIRRIIAAVARYYRLKPADLLGASQRRCHVRPRGLAIHCIRLLTRKSTHAIGEACGGRDHTTILHSLRVTEALLRTDPGYAGDLNEILISLQSPSTDLSSACRF